MEHLGLIGSGVWGIEWSRDDDVTRPRKVKTVTQIHFSLDISKILGDRVSAPMEHL